MPDLPTTASSSRQASGPKMLATVIRAFAATTDGDLGLTVGERIVVTKANPDKQWWRGYRESDRSAKGIFPKTYVEIEGGGTGGAEAEATAVAVAPPQGPDPGASPAPVELETVSLQKGNDAEGYGGAAAAGAAAHTPLQQPPTAVAQTLPAIPPNDRADVGGAAERALPPPPVAALPPPLPVAAAAAPAAEQPLSAPTTTATSLQRPPCCLGLPLGEGRPLTHQGVPVTYQNWGLFGVSARDGAHWGGAAKHDGLPALPLAYAYDYVPRGFGYVDETLVGSPSCAEVPPPSHSGAISEPARPGA
jgi:hypothetical protein